MYEVVRSPAEYDGSNLEVRVDTAVLPDGSPVEREVVEHVSAALLAAAHGSARPAATG